MTEEEGLAMVREPRTFYPGTAAGFAFAASAVLANWRLFDLCPWWTPVLLSWFSVEAGVSSVWAWRVWRSCREGA